MIWIYQDNFTPNSLLQVLFGARQAFFEKSLHGNTLQLNVDRLKGLMKRTIIIKCRKRSQESGQQGKELQKWKSNIDRGLISKENILKVCILKL